MKTLFSLRPIDIDDEEIDFNLICNELDIHPECVEIADEAYTQDAIQAEAFRYALEEVTGGLDNTYMSIDGDTDVYNIEENFLVVKKSFNGCLVMSCAPEVRRAFDEAYRRHL
nr:MAG TPA: hypothetical protein [Caudoviricetes sp.]